MMSYDKVSLLLCRCRLHERNYYIKGEKGPLHRCIDDALTFYATGDVHITYCSLKVSRLRRQ